MKNDSLIDKSTQFESKDKEAHKGAIQRFLDKDALAICPNKKFHSLTRRLLELPKIVDVTPELIDEVVRQYLSEEPSIRAEASKLLAESAKLWGEKIKGEKRK